MAGFTVYPAIDLHHGQVVRLAQGDLERQTVYGTDPAAAARHWLDMGARWLHIVNLDGAFENPDQTNRFALSAILNAARESNPPGRVQFGGGLRSLEDILQALEAGVSRVVLGTAAVQSPELVFQALEQFGPEHVALGLDARDGRLMLRGWTEGSALTPVDLALQFVHMGLRTIVFTDITRDGMGSGINLSASQELAHTSGLQVIASGGVRTLADIQQVRQVGLSGVIVGRALYEGSLKLPEALKLERRHEG